MSLGLQGRDQIVVSRGSEGEVQSVVIKSCLSLTKMMNHLKASHGLQIQNWPLPEGHDHSSMLVRELILKLQNQWQLPYTHDEVCHCRSVNTSVVDQAIVAGAHSVEEIQRETMACTSCGTCRPDVENLLNYRLSFLRK